MQIKFTGNPATGGDGKKIDTAGGPITMCGVVFPAGKWVTIEDEALIAKFSGNSHFTCKDEAEPATPPVTEEEEPDGDAG